MPGTQIDCRSAPATETDLFSWKSVNIFLVSFIVKWMNRTFLVSYLKNGVELALGGYLVLMGFYVRSFAFNNVSPPGGTGTFMLPEVTHAYFNPAAASMALIWGYILIGIGAALVLLSVLGITVNFMQRTGKTSGSLT